MLSPEMDEGLGRRDQRVTPGVSRREISWRAGGLRAVRHGVRALPVWADALILLVLAGHLLAGVAAAPYGRDEAVQISLTHDAGTLVTDPGSLLPGAGSTPVQDAVRLGYGSFTRYLAAAGWYPVAGRGRPRPLDLAALGPSALTGTPVPLRPVSRDDLLAARAGPAAFSVLALLMLFFLARRLLGRPAATVTVLVFALQPAVLETGRQVADSGLTWLLGLAAVHVGAGIGARLSAGREPTLGAWTALAVWSGLCLAAGLTAAPFLLGAASFCLAGLVRGQLRRQQQLIAGQPVGGPWIGRGAGWFLVSGFGALCVWVLVSPSLWGWLPERLAARHDDFPWLVANGLVADPGAQGWPGRLAALSRLLVGGPVAGVLLSAAAVVSTAMLLWVAQAPGRGVGRVRAICLLVWAVAASAWFVLWPSDQPDHRVPVLVVASLLAGAIVSRAQPGPIRPSGQAVRPGR